MTWSDNRDALASGAGRMDPNVYFDKIVINPQIAVAEPASLSLLGLGLAGFGIARRHKAS